MSDDELFDQLSGSASSGEDNGDALQSASSRSESPSGSDEEASGSGSLSDSDEEASPSPRPSPAAVARVAQRNPAAAACKLPVVPRASVHGQRKAPAPLRNAVGNVEFRQWVADRAQRWDRWLQWQVLVDRALDYGVREGDTLVPLTARTDAGVWNGLRAASLNYTGLVDPPAPLPPPAPLQGPYRSLFQNEEEVPIFRQLVRSVVTADMHALDNTVMYDDERRLVEHRVECTRWVRSFPPPNHAAEDARVASLYDWSEYALIAERFVEGLRTNGFPWEGRRWNIDTLYAAEDIPTLTTLQLLRGDYDEAPDGLLLVEVTNEESQKLLSDVYRKESGHFHVSREEKRVLQLLAQDDNNNEEAMVGTVVPADVLRQFVPRYCPDDLNAAEAAAAVAAPLEWTSERLTAFLNRTTGDEHSLPEAFWQAVLVCLFHKYGPEAIVRGAFRIPPPLYFIGPNVGRAFAPNDTLYVWVPADDETRGRWEAQPDFPSDAFASYLKMANPFLGDANHETARWTPENFRALSDQVQRGGGEDDGGAPATGAAARKRRVRRPWSAFEQLSIQSAVAEWVGDTTVRVRRYKAEWLSNDGPRSFARDAQWRFVRIHYPVFHFNGRTQVDLKDKWRTMHGRAEHRDIRPVGGADVEEGMVPIGTLLSTLCSEPVDVLPGSTYWEEVRERLVHHEFMTPEVAEVLPSATGLREAVQRLGHTPFYIVDGQGTVLERTLANGRTYVATAVGRRPPRHQDSETGAWFGQSVVHVRVPYTNQQFKQQDLHVYDSCHVHRDNGLRLDKVTVVFMYGIKETPVASPYGYRGNAGGSTNVLLAACLPPPPRYAADNPAAMEFEW